MAAQLQDPVEEVFARLSMLEFALEVIYANWLAGRPAKESEAFRRDLVEKNKRGYGRLTVDPQAVESMQRIVQRSNKMMERFAHKVATREREFREQRTPGRPGRP
jgi:hypothetical protein